MIDFIQRFLRLNPRTNDGNTLLHLVVWHETPIEKDNVRKVCKLPCVETMKLILHAGCDIYAVNTEGNTPLHLAVKFKPEPSEVEILREILLLLLDMGADPKLENKNGQTPLDSCQTDEARRILSEKRGLSAINVDVGYVRKFQMLRFNFVKSFLLLLLRNESTYFWPVVAILLRHANVCPSLSERLEQFGTGLKSRLVWNETIYRNAPVILNKRMFSSSRGSNCASGHQIL